MCELEPLSTEALAARFHGDAQAAVQELLLVHRAIRVTIAGEPRWAAIEDAARLCDALGITLSKDIPAAFLQSVADPLRDLLSRYARAFYYRPASAPFRAVPGSGQCHAGAPARTGQTVKGRFWPAGC